MQAADHNSVGAASFQSVRLRLGLAGKLSEGVFVVDLLLVTHLVNQRGE